MCTSQARESPEMLVALGAQIALGEFVVGRTSERLHAACDRLAAWLQQADSIVFRVQSWHELRNDESSADAPPDLRAYLGGHAVRNRRRFHSQLTELAAAADGVAYTRALVDIVRELKRPCLRLRLLQESHTLTTPCTLF